jgi:hypothetical protein
MQISTHTLIEVAVVHPDIPINGCLVSDFVNFACKELGINPEKITVASWDIEDEISGMCIDESESEFIILVNETERNLTEVFNTIAHEMIHVKQYMKENLGWFLDNRSYIPYRERWWEKEAFENSVSLVKKFAEGLNK